MTQLHKGDENLKVSVYIGVRVVYMLVSLDILKDGVVEEQKTQLWAL